MKNIFYIFGLSFSFFGIPLFYFLTLDTKVSMTYETEIGECISRISEIDLCKQQELFLNLTYGCGIVFIILLGILIVKTLKLKP